jgi:hypothetical protein
VQLSQQLLPQPGWCARCSSQPTEPEASPRCAAALPQTVNTGSLFSATMLIVAYGYMVGAGAVPEWHECMLRTCCTSQPVPPAWQLPPHAGSTPSRLAALCHMPCPALPYAAQASLCAPALQVLSWGGYSFIINLLPIYCLFCIVTGRLNSRMYLAFSPLVVVGTLMSGGPLAGLAWC